MAIDNAEERRAIAGGVGLPWIGPGQTPFASKDQEWREEAGHGYPGILTGGEPVPTPAEPRGGYAGNWTMTHRIFVYTKTKPRKRRSRRARARR